MKTRLLLILVLIAANVFAQHNSSYTQYMFNGLLLNPAYAGSNDALNLTSLYRKQWLGMDGAPTTITFSGHMPLKNKRLNIGLIMMSDKFGVSEHNKAGFVYAYRFKLFKGQLSFGLQAGVDAYTANWERVRTTQLRDPSFTINTDRKILPQAGFGMYYYTNTVYLGISLPGMIANDLNKYQTAAFNAGCVFNMDDNFKIKPAMLVKYIYNSPVDVNISSTFYWKNVLGVGFGYSFNGTTMAFMDLRINDQFRFGYAYDYAFSSIRTYSSGSHELMLRYLFQYKINAPSARYF